MNSKAKVVTLSPENHALTFEKLAKLIRFWNINYTTRPHLADIEDQILKDIGISRTAAVAESKKPFWR